MDTEVKMTGRLIAAARALAGISREDFGRVAEISTEVIASMEASGSARLDSPSDVEAICRAFDQFGVVIIDERDGMGAGVRLKFTRQDVNQLLRLEDEGGISRPDDNP